MGLRQMIINFITKTTKQYDNRNVTITDVNNAFNKLENRINSTEDDELREILSIEIKDSIQKYRRIINEFLACCENKEEFNEICAVILEQVNDTIKDVDRIIEKENRRFKR